MVANEKRNPYLIDYGQSRKVQYQRERYPKVQPQRQSHQRVQPQRQSHQRVQPQRQSHQRVQPQRVQSQRATRAIKRAQKRRRLMIRRGIFLVISFLFMYLVIISLSKLLTAGMEIFDKQKRNNEFVNTEPASANGGIAEELVQGIPFSDYALHPTWTEDFLTPNEYSRPGDALKEINSIFVHYTANPGTSAAQNRSYFEQQKDTHERSVSAHFIIGYDGEIIQCVPLDEIAYAVQTRNEDSVSIECCYLAEDGSFTQETYDSLIKLLQWLVATYDLDADEDILRHYDCGGKKCPIYYTENEDAWEDLKEDVKTL